MWNLKFRNNIGQVAPKYSLSLGTYLSFSLRVILSPVEHFVEKSGENVFPKTPIINYLFYV